MISTRHYEYNYAFVILFCVGGFDVIGKSYWINLVLLSNDDLIISFALYPVY